MSHWHIADCLWILVPIRRSSVMDIKMRWRWPSSSGQWRAGRLAEKWGSFSETCRYILSTHCTGNITNLDQSEFNITLNFFIKSNPVTISIAFLFFRSVAYLIPTKESSAPMAYISDILIISISFWEQQWILDCLRYYKSLFKIMSFDEVTFTYIYNV